MRPVRLELEGFSTFRSPTSVSFEGTDLVVFVGPTGSGKSSLIDGITFALYGSVSRYDDLRVVEPVIHKLATEAKVRLDFELNGVRYSSVRVVRRLAKGGATTKEARLVRFEPDGTETTLAGTPREMAEAVPSLLGLDFEQFTRTVVLPQGEFAAFLHEDKGKRQQLLRQLLDVGIYERMGRLACSRKAEAEVRAGVLREQLDERTPMSDDELGALHERVAVLEALGSALPKKLEDIRTIDTDALACEPPLKELDTLAAVLREIEVPAMLADLGPRIEAATSAAQSAEEELDRAREARSAAQHAATEAGEPNDQQRVLTALERVADIDRDLETQRAAGAAAQDVATATRGHADELAAALGVAVAQLDVARQEAGLGAAIEALQVGEACPVCRQPVHELPEHDVDAALLAAKQVHAEAATVSTAAEKAASAAASEAAVLTTAVKTLEREREQRTADIPAGSTEEALTELLALAVVAKAAVADALAAVDAAERAQKSTQTASAAVRAEEQSARVDLGATRDRVASRRPPQLPGIALVDDWQLLAAWATEDAALAETEAAELRLRIDELRTARRSLVSTIETDCEAAGISGAMSQVEAIVATATAETRAQITAELAQRERVTKVVEDIKALEETVAVHGELGRLLSVDGFERWLLQAALDGLVQRATGRLLELSSGQYSLEADDGEFWIRDHHNADERRSVRTLSGGETFLASLALALALADNIAELAVEGGPRLESMFLDEGFGTLDPDTLDVVAAAIEELSSTGRLIGIVTHIRDLADRMPVLFEVRKGAVTATVERIEA